MITLEARFCAVFSNEIFGKLVKFQRGYAGNGFLHRFFQNISEDFSSHSHFLDFRLADFGDFGYKVFDGSDRFINILGKVDKAQDELLLVEDALLEFLEEWLDEIDNINSVVTAKELYSGLKRIAMNQDIDFQFKTPRALSMKLCHQSKNLKRFFDFEIVKRSGRPHLYKFSKIDDPKISI